jgi:hypothetical protein
MIKPTPEEVIEHLINKMFEYANLPQRYDDIKDRKDEWYKEYTMTQDQSYAFKAYAIPYLRKALKTGHYTADTEYQWFDLVYGLKISDKKKSNNFEDLE